MPAPAIQVHATQRVNYNMTFWLMMILHVVYHILVFRFVNTIYLDSDQAFMWAGVADYAKGIFHEPRFYGQDYNTFLEALVAVPFTWIGIPVYYALPLATHICAFLPWVVPALFFYKRREMIRGAAFLAVPLCLLLPYDVLTGIPRGFVSGLAFTLFFAHSLLAPHRTGWIAANTLLAVAGFFINPNSLLVSGPCFFYLWLCNVRNPRFYLTIALAVPASLGCWFLFDRFYTLHPEYVIYGVNLEFSAEYLRENLIHLHDRLPHVSFFSATHTWFTGAAFVLLLAALFIHNRNAFFAALMVPLIILISLASNKGGDGSLWPFYSFGRNYIGLPLFFALFIMLLPARNQFATALVVAALATAVYKLATFNKTIRDFYDESRWLGVHLVKVDDALHAMRVYKKACENHHASLLMVSNNFWLNTVLAYGGGAVHADFPLALETNNERRYWLREGLAQEVTNKFVYISSRQDLEKLVKQEKFSLKRLDDYGLYLVSENSLTNAEFIAIVWEAEK